MTSEIIVRPIVPADLPLLRVLHARVFGPGRLTRTAYRIREGTPPISEFCSLALLASEVVASIRFTEVAIGDTGGALLLGPLAVETRYAGLGYGKRLVAEGVEAARAAGRKLVVLVGDMPYYARFGFVQVPPGHILFPGPVDPARVLAAELEPGSLAAYRGPIAAAP